MSIRKFTPGKPENKRIIPASFRHEIFTALVFQYAWFEVLVERHQRGRAANAALMGRLEDTGLALVWYIEAGYVNVTYDELMKRVEAIKNGL